MKQLNFRRFTLLAIGAVLIASTAIASEEKWTGKAFPEKTFEVPNGDPIPAVFPEADLTIIDFWATWCKPCIAQIRHLDEVLPEITGGKVEVILVNVSDSQKKIDAFTKRHKPKHPIATLDREKVKNLGVGPLPRTLVLDASGKVVADHEGVMSKADLKEKIEGLLAQKTTSDPSSADAESDN